MVATAASASAWQHDRYTVTSTDTQVAQLTNNFVRSGPERAICQRLAPGRQNGRVVGRYSSIVGEKISEAGKDVLPGLACVRARQLFCNL